MLPTASHFLRSKGWSPYNGPESPTTGVLALLASLHVSDTLSRGIRLTISPECRTLPLDTCMACSLSFRILLTAHLGEDATANNPFKTVPHTHSLFPTLAFFLSRAHTIFHMLRHSFLVAFRQAEGGYLLVCSLMNPQWLKQHLTHSKNSAIFFLNKMSSPGFKGSYMLMNPPNFSGLCSGEYIISANKPFVPQHLGPSGCIAIHERDSISEFILC